MKTCLETFKMRKYNLKVSSTFSGQRSSCLRKYTANSNKNEKLWSAFRNCMYKTNQKQDIQEGNKVSIIGAGGVGMSCAISLLSKGITNNLALYDIDKKKANSEHLDLLHGSWFLKNCHIKQCCNTEVTNDSRVVVVACSSGIKNGESRQDLAHKNADIIKSVMPDLVKQSPKAIYLILSNPADVMTWVARKVTNLPYERCLSTGCLLDSARFRHFIAELLGVATSSVYGFVLGEHGDSSVPIWSSVTVGGVRLQKLLPALGTEQDPMKWSEVHKKVVKSALFASKGKGYTNWAIGLSAADVVAAIFENRNRVLPLSTNAAGLCGINEEVFLSLPCIVNNWGISGVIRPSLSDVELAALKKSAETLLKAQSSIKF